VAERDRERTAEGRFTSTVVVASLSVVLTIALLIIVYLLVRVPSAAPIEIHPPQPTVTRSPTATPSPVTVYVTGAVSQPGVVQVPAGGRVQDAVSAAGGLARDADPERVNLAAPLSDGQHLHVPAVGEMTGPVGTDGSGSTRLQLININTATVEELVALPGVGDVTASNILAYREEHGPFATIEEVMNVPGIGEVKFDGFKDMITVGP
jgi:competence protein ComEA